MFLLALLAAGCEATDEGEDAQSSQDIGSETTTSCTTAAHVTNADTVENEAPCCASHEGVMVYFSDSCNWAQRTGGEWMRTASIRSADADAGGSD